MSIRRGQVYLAALNPTVESQIAKTRPTVIVSNNINNTHANTVIIVPLTSLSGGEVHPYEVFIPKGEGVLPKGSKVKASQILTIDKKRLIKRLGALKEDLIGCIGEAIKIHLDLP